MLPVASDAVPDGAVAVRGGLIADVGPAGDVMARHPGLPVEDLGARIVTPGFVDAHCHLEWSLLDGLLPPADFAPWLGGMLAMRLRMEPADHVTAARWGALRALRAGTTTLADSGPTGAGATALAESGLRGLVHLEVFGRETGPEAAAAAAAFEERLGALDQAVGPRARAGVSPHAPYTVGPGLWAALRARPGVEGRPWATHVAESDAETRTVAAGEGPLAELFARAGLVPGRWEGRDGDGVVPRLAAGDALRPAMVAAHCVRLGPGDAAALAGAGVTVAHCPRSNVHLRCGRAPVEHVLGAGIPLGLGTDSPASGGDYDLRAEARACRAVHAGTWQADAEQLLRAITLGGAEALGMAGSIGALTPGRAADLVAVDPAGAAPGAPQERVLDPASRVDLVVVGGEVLLRDGVAGRVDADAIDRGATEARLGLC